MSLLVTFLLNPFDQYIPMTSFFRATPTSECFIFQFTKRVHQLFVGKQVFLVSGYNDLTRSSFRKTFPELFWISPFVILTVWQSTNVDIIWFLFKMNHLYGMIVFLFRFFETVKKIIHFFLS